MFRNNNVRVIVDAGHGGVDSGAVNGNILEKDFTLQAAEYIFNRLNQLGIPAKMTRTEDVSVPKNERIAKVDQLYGRDEDVILVSNHINAGGGEGAEVVYALRNDPTFANMILNNIGYAGQIKRKVYQRRLPENPNKDYYYIIRETSPRESVLIEYGFIDNQRDLRKLQTDLDKYAEGVVKAIADYTNTPYTAPGASTVTGDYYTVVRGDSLWSIANKFGISVNELKQLNNLSSNLITIGQKLRIPSQDNVDTDTYVVVKGDSLWSIARKLGVSVNDLVNYNNLSSLTLQIGQQLKIPPTNQIVYTVQNGDNLLSTYLTIGQQLIIK